MKTGLLLLWAGVLVGCAAGPDYHEPQRPLPAHFGNARYPSVGEGQVAAQFWTLLNDPTLDGLIADALAANNDLARAADNLEASRAAARLVGFDAYPTIRVGGSYSHALASQHQFIGAANATRAQRTIDTYEAGFDALWELDFFGRIRRNKEAARADVGAAEATLRDAIVIVTSEVARDYCVLRGLQEQLAVAERNSVNQQRTLTLTQTRLSAGRGTELDVSRAAAQLATTLAGIPQLQAAITITIHRLSVLTGRLPEELLPDLSQPRPMPALPALNDIGAPDALLRRRPDIRVAERNLAAATARIGVSMADLFPRVTFVGSVGFSAGSWRDLGSADSQTHFVAPGLSWAAFDLGRVRARIGVARAQADAALAGYRAAVLNALEDTENSLANFGESQRREAILELAAQESARAARLAGDRFKGGLSDFLTVLQAERDALSAEESLVQARTQTATALVAVYKSLGGGWMAH